MRLPVRTALLQNIHIVSMVKITVRLPVRTALLQNVHDSDVWTEQCDYQSERHCSKTELPDDLVMGECDYQSERHCSKTLRNQINELLCAITSQNGTAPKHRGVM